MGVNIGHGDRRVTDAIAEQAERLAYISPFMAFEGRALLGEKLAELMPGDIEKFFFTLGGAEANENAMKIAKHGHRAAEDHRALPLLPRRDVRSDDAHRRPAALAERARDVGGVVHVLDPYHGIAAGAGRRADGARYPRGDDQLEGPETIAAFFLETVTGTNGILVPPDGYLQGVRELCDEVRDPHGEPTR